MFHFAATLHSSLETLHFVFSPVPQQLQDEFRKLVFVGASPTRGSIYGDHDVIAASRPVTAFVPVRIRLVTPI